MIQMPQRSVTRFFIPLIDVLILMFGVFLLMPVIPSSGDTGEGAGPLTVEERKELGQLREQKQTWEDVQAMKQELDRLKKEKLQTLQQRLAIRVLEIGDRGQLFYYDPLKPSDRLIEITEANVQDMIRRQQQAAGDQEPYFLIMYPRPESGFPQYPLQEQREKYDRWFANVVHGYDIPVLSR